MNTNKIIIGILLAFVLAMASCGMSACGQDATTEPLTTAQKTNNFAKSVTEIKEGEGYDITLKDVVVTFPYDAAYTRLTEEGEEEEVFVSTDANATASAELFFGKNQNGDPTLKGYVAIEADMTKSEGDANQEVSDVVMHASFKTHLFAEGEKAFVKYALVVTYPGIPEQFREINKIEEGKSYVVTVDQLIEYVQSIIPGELPSAPEEGDSETGPTVSAVAKTLGYKMVGFVVEEILPALTSGAENNDAAVEKAVAFFKSAAISVTDKDGTITVCPDFDKMRQFNNELYTTKLAALIDKYAGEGTFDSIKKKAYAALDYTVGDLLEDLESRGVTEKKIMDFLDECASEIAGEDITFAQLISVDEEAFAEVVAYVKAMSVTDILGEFVPGMSVTQRMGVAFSFLETSTAYDLLVTVANGAADVNMNKVDLKQTVDNAINFASCAFNFKLTLNAKGEFVSYERNITLDKTAIEELKKLLGDQAEDISEINFNATVSIRIGAFENQSGFDYEAMANDKANEPLPLPELELPLPDFDPVLPEYPSLEYIFGKKLAA